MWNPFNNSSPSQVVLTETGKRAAFNQDERGLNFVIVQELDSHGGIRTLQQLARDTGIDYKELKARVNLLKSAGIVKVGGEMEALE